MVFRVKRAKKFVKMMCGWQKHEKFRRAHIYDAAKGICQKNGMSSFFCSDMPQQNCFEDIPILKKFNENFGRWCSRYTLWIRKLVVFTWINSLEMTYVTPTRTLSISGLKSRVLKLPFFNYLKMMVESGLDFLF